MAQSPHEVVVESCASQPSLGFVLQSPKPAWHAPTMQLGAEPPQAAVAF